MGYFRTPLFLEVRSFAALHGLNPQPYLTESVFKIVLQKSTPAQIRQLILYISNNNGLVDRFVGEFTFQKRLCKHFMSGKVEVRRDPRAVPAFRFYLT